MNSDATDKLTRVEALAREVRMDAATLQSFQFTPSLVSKDSHRRYLNMAKKNNNEMGDIIRSLHKNRANLEKWQVQLLNRLLPKMETMSDEIEAAINFHNKNFESDFFLPTYEDYVDTIYNKADSIVKTVDRFFEWIEGVRAKKKLQAS
jgi:hypothetical protein